MATNFSPKQLSTLASVPDLAADAGVSESYMWALSKRHGFPQPIRLGPKCTRFDRAAVLTWIRDNGNAAPKPKIRKTMNESPTLTRAE